MRNCASKVENWTNSSGAGLRHERGYSNHDHRRRVTNESNEHLDKPPITIVTVGARAQQSRTSLTIGTPTLAALRISTGSDGGEEVPVGASGVEE